MKRFLIASFICLLPFSIRAKELPKPYNLIERINAVFAVDSALDGIQTGFLGETDEDDYTYYIDYGKYAISLFEPEELVEGGTVSEVKLLIDSIAGYVGQRLSETDFFIKHPEFINSEEFKSLFRGNMQTIETLVDAVFSPNADKPVQEFMEDAGYKGVDEKFTSYIDAKDLEFIKKYTSGIYEKDVESDKDFSEGKDKFNMVYHNGDTYFQGNFQDMGKYGMLGEFDDILIIGTEVAESNNKALVSGVVHHLTQYLKDVEAIGKDYCGDGHCADEYEDVEFFKFINKGITPSSKYILQGILDARTYSEDVVFLYNEKEKLRKEMEVLENELEKYSNGERVFFAAGQTDLGYEVGYSDVDDAIKKLYEGKKLEYEQFEKRYNDIVSLDENPAAAAFDKAIKEGKTIEEARHIASVALLNSDFYANIIRLNEVIDEEDIDAINEMFGLRPKVVSPEEIIRMLGDDFFTLEDLYSAENFWVNFCGYNGTKETEECKKAQKRWQDKHCNNVCNTFDSFVSRFIYNPNNRSIDADTAIERMEKVFNIDKNTCGINCGKNRKLTSKEDESKYKKYRVCCSMKWDFSFDYPWNSSK